MRAGKLHLPTFRDDPADAEITSHKLMVRAGYILKIGSGLYVYGPLMFRVIEKINRVIREELGAVDAIEIQMPVLQPRELWERSGRWEVYTQSNTMLTVTDRKSAEYGLAPTAEEVVTAYVDATTSSYKQLPVCLYQIHTKLRDEIRPRFGLLRGKEFLMKDAYSFDADEAGLDISYEAMRVAYHRIFASLGLEAFGVDADPGDIGGSGSMEFMVAADTGEDAILLEPGTTYAANVEKAESQVPASPAAGEAPKPMHIEDTPDIRTVADLVGFFPELSADRMVKTVLYQGTSTETDRLFAVLIRGDQEINEVKLNGKTGALALRMLTGDEIERHTGAEMGFAGPVGLPKAFTILADNTVADLPNFLCGCNQTDKHALDVNLGRDCAMPEFADLRLAHAGEPGPRTGAPLEERRGIEVGHIFKLGTKYSGAMGANFMDNNGKPATYVMGCYGIGVSRVAASAVEQNSDDMGIKWPVPLAPFELAIGCLNVKKEDHVAGAVALYEKFQAAGVDTLLDDRQMSPGAKMKDLELMGFPFTVIVGRDYPKDGTVEIRDRHAGEQWSASVDEAVAEVAKRIEAARSGLLTDSTGQAAD